MKVYKLQFPAGEATHTYWLESLEDAAFLTQILTESRGSSRCESVDVADAREAVRTNNQRGE